MRRKPRDDPLSTVIVVSARLLTQAGFLIYNAFTCAAMDTQPSGGLSMPLGGAAVGAPLPLSSRQYTAGKAGLGSIYASSSE